MTCIACGVTERSFVRRPPSNMVVAVVEVYSLARRQAKKPRQIAAHTMARSVALRLDLISALRIAAMWGWRIGLLAFLVLLACAHATPVTARSTLREERSLPFSLAICRRQFVAGVSASAVDEASQKMTTINMHKGLYQFNRLPYGVASAPAVFQGIMDKLLVGLEGVSKYLDDILIAAPTRRLLLERLNTVLSILLQAGLKLKKSKCMFFSDSVQYLVFKIDASGLHATDEKVQAVQTARAPTNVTELKSFLGLVKYYGQFIENLASLVQPLYDLQKRNTVWKWQAPQQQAFRALKSALSAPPVLVHYSPSRPLRLTCNASGTGIGAVLSHVMPEGQEQPIAYASRSLTTSERNYSQLEREALAIVFGVTKFHLYLYGRHFNLVTDNRPLAVIFGPKRGIPQSQPCGCSVGL